MKIKQITISLDEYERLITAENPNRADYEIRFKGKKIDDVVAIIRHTLSMNKIKNKEEFIEGPDIDNLFKDDPVGDKNISLCNFEFKCRIDENGLLVIANRDIDDSVVSDTVNIPLISDTIKQIESLKKDGTRKDTIT